jgi:hypothetical protein
MRRPPPLTDSQKVRLSKLEPALRDAVRRGDYEFAKRVTADIQVVLRPTGHETRLMQAKSWLFEAALEADRLETAISGFQGVRQKMSPKTRIYLEASALLAICHLRRRDLDRAEPLMAEVLRNEDVISSERRRRQFRLRIIARFEEEGVLAALVGPTFEPLNLERVQEEDGRIVQTQTEDEILAIIGREVPPEVIKVLLRIHEFAGRQLPAADVKLLAPARTVIEKTAVGRTIYNATTRVVWRSLCDPTSEVYKMWCSEGMMAIIDKKFLTASIVTAMAGMKLGAFALAAALAAMVFKMGLEVFCDVARPSSVMIPISDKK